MKRVLVCIGVVALIAGCGVSKEIVAQKDAAYEVCRSDLKACRKGLATCQTERDAAKSEASRLRAEVASLRGKVESAEKDLVAARTARDETDADLRKVQQELRSLQEETSAAKRDAERAQREAAALKQRSNELRAGLQKEIDERTVEIEDLKGKLSVRVLDEILFNSGSAEILPQGRTVLEKLASVLSGGTEMIRIEGHTDDVPIGAALKARYFSNWELSAARASSVVRYFQSAKNIEPTRLEAVGLSEYRSVVPNDTPENRQKNRRVEIVLTAAR